MMLEKFFHRRSRPAKGNSRECQQGALQQATSRAGNDADLLRVRGETELGRLAGFPSSFFASFVDKTP